MNQEDYKEETNNYTDNSKS